MGQSSSRYHGSSSSDRNTATTNCSTSSSPTSGATLNTENQSTSTSDTITDTPPRSRRALVRRSILNLVKPNGIRSRVNSTPATTSGNKNTRKSWRNSMRWGKEHISATQEVGTSPSESTAGPRAPSPTTSAIDLHNDDNDDKPVETRAPNFEISPVEEPERSTDASSTPLHPIPSEPTINAETEDVGQNTDSWLHDQDTHEPPSQSDSRGTLNTDDVNFTEQDDPGDTSEPLFAVPPPISMQTPVSMPENHPPTSARQFPPPGTLVVVQGIVHTTDVSRNPSLPTASDLERPSMASLAGVGHRPRSTATTASTEGNSATPRNRLSALLRSRPASMVSSRPSSAVPLSEVNLSSPSIPPTSTSDDDTHPERETEASGPDSDTLVENRGTTQNTSPEAPQEPIFPSPPSMGANPENERPPMISSSSIDVLGTLLSVAAAATAASLLTGSSEPILSSGLAPPAPNSASNAGTNQVVLPTPPPSSSSPMNDLSAAGRAERMRQAWGTIRERLGLRSGGPNGPADRSPTVASENGQRAATTDTRELMLAEMARAFNVGLGLGNTPTTVPGGPSTPAPAVSADEEGTTGGDSQTSIPPEGSFERFLVDLQADLRTALAQDGVSNPTTDRPQTGDEPGVNIDSDPPSSPDIVPVVAHESQGSQRVPTPVPDFEDVSDSDSEFETTEDDDENYRRHAFTTPTGVPISNQQEPPNIRDEPGRIDANGRINWWRLYRFPPIISPRAQGLGLTTNTPPSFPPMQSLSTALPTPTSLPQSETPISASPLEPTNGGSTPITSNSRPLSTPTVTPIVTNSVIPVIVVGLQSVNSTWRPDTPITNDGMDIFRSGHTASPSMDSERDEIEDMGDMDAFGNQNQQTRGRGMRWQSRAANAIRNLRHGRRPASGGGQHTGVGGHGSRTFLIYVIGGYYPPDHSIVTGEPNDFESFEALLELADLLGQVKPPTASKEEIAKSGLQVIKPSQLEQYEKEGKIASNCVDRCLICLDDYEASEDLRVMMCRHAFHKECVDKWLLTGRNNCPACRSKGVSAESTGPQITTPEA